MNNQYSLSQLGWNHFFQQQLSLEEWEAFTIARVVGQERSLITVVTEAGNISLPIISTMPPITVGDWVLLAPDGRFERLLDRSSLFQRKAAGTKVASQLIAANIDTVFVVSSMNSDFNLNRIERYLALAHEAGVEPVVVLTKVDCCHNREDYVEKAQALNSLLPVITVNSLERESVEALKDWCGIGQTVAFLGSSGVGKSTLVNTLMENEAQKTNAIREDDQKGRHTTTSRSILMMPSGGLLIDTPGMRELQLADCEQGVEETFAEIVELARQCKFSDCTHQSEPGCAVRNAIDSEALDERRLLNYLKLMKEQAHNSASLAEKRAKDREFGRMVRSVMKTKQDLKR